MNGDSSIIKTKVLVPGKRRDLLHRARLVDFVHEHIDHKLILISASAGYGKTSLMIDFAHDTDMPVCWYSLDEWDQDVRIFLEYLVASIAERFPGFGERTLAALRAGMRAEGPASVAGSLVNEIYESVPDYFALVVDDYHLVEDSKEVATVIGFLLRRLPDNCHMVLVSRTTTPALPIVELTARQEMVGLGSSDLSFTAGEIQELLRRSYDIDLPMEQADTLAQESEGWITAILLMTHNWKGLLRTMALSRGDQSQVFAYLAKEVLNQQPGDVQDFLIGSSILQRMNPSLCDLLLDTDRAREMLALLEDKNLFISRLTGDGEDWYRYHQLFQEFLRSKLREDGERCRTLHLKAGGLFEVQEDWDQAIRHFLEAEAYGRSQKLVEAVAPRAFSSGRWSSLLFWTDSLIHSGNGSPWMYYWQAKVHTESGRLDEAAKSLERARLGFSQRENRAGVVASVLQESYIHRLRADYDQAIDSAHEVLSALRDSGEEEIKARTLRTLGICYGLQGRLEDGLRHLEKALLLFESLGEGCEYDVAATLSDLGTTYHAADIDKYFHYSRKALALWRWLGAIGPLAMTLNNIGVVEYRQERFDEALVTLHEALEESRQAGLIRPRAYAEATIGDVYRARGEYPLAQQAYETALALAEEAAEGFLIGYLWDALGNVERAQGHYEKAAKFIERGLEIAYGHGSDREVAAAHISLGILLHVQGRDSEALRVLQQAVSSLRDTGAKQELAKAQLHLAAVLFSQQALDEARLYLEMALDVIAESGFDPLLVDEGTGSCSLLEHAIGEASTSGFRKLLRRLLDYTEPPRDVPAPAPSEGADRRLEFFAFGSSTVRRAGQVVEARELRLRAKEMLFFLLANPVATKDQIVAALWPELPLAKAHSTFHFHLFQVRRLLGGTDAVSYEGGVYRLESRQYWYDVNEFHRNLAKANRARVAQRERYLTEAITLCRGDYLEDIYSEWAESPRGSLRREYHQALEDLARHQSEHGELEAAAGSCRTLLDKDSLREDIHRLLISILLEEGDRAGAIRQFKTLRKILRDELGADPSEKTLDLLRGLLSDDE